MTKSIKDVLEQSLLQAVEDGGNTVNGLVTIRLEALKEIEAIMSEQVIGEDFDIPAEMEKVGRDFQKLDAIAKTGGLLNNHKSELRKRLHTALYGKESK